MTHNASIKRRQTRLRLLAAAHVERSREAGMEAGIEEVAPWTH